MLFPCKQSVYSLSRSSLSPPACLSTPAFFPKNHALHHCSFKATLMFNMAKIFQCQRHDAHLLFFQNLSDVLRSKNISVPKTWCFIAILSKTLWCLTWEKYFSARDMTLFINQFSTMFKSWMRNIFTGIYWHSLKQMHLFPYSISKS